MRDNLHIQLLGRPGAGKSTLAASAPKPMLVALFDPPDKAQPYLDRGIPTEIKKGDYCYYRDVMSKKEPEKLVIRVEYWGESNTTNPTAYPRFLARFVNIEQEISTAPWATVVMDTATFFELSARYYSEGGLNKEVKDGRQHYAFSAKACEQFIMMRFPNMLLTNSFVLCHVDDQKTETEGEESKTVIRKMAALPGKLPDRVSGAFGEVWRIYKDEASGGRVLQTQQRPNNTFDCKSLKGFPDYLYPHWDEIWKALEKEKANGVS